MQNRRGSGLHVNERTPKGHKSVVFPRQAAAPGPNRLLAGGHEPVDVWGEVAEHHVVTMLPQLPAVEEDERACSSSGCARRGARCPQLRDRRDVLQPPAYAPPERSGKRAARYNVVGVLLLGATDVAQSILEDVFAL
jgi:hypothetical protein